MLAVAVIDEYQGAAEEEYYEVSADAAEAEEAVEE